MDVAVCEKMLEALVNVGPHPALHVGELAIGRVPAQFDGLHVLIHEDSLASFHTEMAKQGFLLSTWLPGAQAASLVPPGARPRPHPLTPNLGYTDWVGAPCSLWIQIYTNWHHGPLLLVDVAHWFDVAQPIAELAEVPELRRYHDQAMRAPLWALLLWQASLVTTCASDVADPAVLTAELHKLYQFSKHAQQNWVQAAARALAYDEEYLERLDHFHTHNPAIITTYARAHGVGPDHTRLVTSPVVAANIGSADLDYGVLYDLSYALQALKAPQVLEVLAAFEDGVVAWDTREGTAAMAEAITGGTAARPRKLWYYPPTPGNVGELSKAAPTFGIAAQLQSPPPPEWREFVDDGRVQVAIDDAPPEGYWSGLTQLQFATIFR